ncbi:hypothetical protein COT27_00860 [Candidatus Kuenenbacteria bacterium CG08_land_8_20_14_0_20_37_23]|uniref:EamA domain-containing protein n=2 Tax=Candidatus Kueneniibacteriota TaxID=1752740 RepID=A0A2M6XTA0_9BACT|nr:MAG: hypothetical protein AUJ29_00955 [Candidatus Kuenenbacteria bacterium CG1_02_38_13]PIU10865.1 MAG: hypothetical protein COT27_00860 [Candidatus Kuenenbacteria bacterium CG08_land_8_20_14_0_20_37_23]
MFWLHITLIAYFLNAIAVVTDKTLLRRAIKNPFVYTFYVATLGSILVVFIFPLGIIWPGWSQFLISISAGGAFSIGLFFLYLGLKKEDASRLAPMVGGLVSIFVFISAILFLDEELSGNQILAFILIIIGTFLIALDFQEHGLWSWLKKKIGTAKNLALPKIRKTLLIALPAALFFGLSYILTKDVYNHQPFLSGFAWTRLGVLVVALLPMLFAKNRYDLRHQKKDTNDSKAKYRFLFGQACGGIGAVSIQYAISIASVSLVQALQGTQYAFVFLAVLLLTYNHPKLLREKISVQIMIQKIIAVMFIALGIWLIADNLA